MRTSVKPSVSPTPTAKTGTGKAGLPSKLFLSPLVMPSVNKKNAGLRSGVRRRRLQQLQQPGSLILRLELRDRSRRDGLEAGAEAEKPQIVIAV